MKRFADTYFFISLFNGRDPAHLKSLTFLDDRSSMLYTTHWVLTEVADGFASRRNRRVFFRLMRILQTLPGATIISADDKLFSSAVDLYARRFDKDWSLTDCSSFVVMDSNNITDALTADHHFVQAGFRALLAQE